MQYNERTVNVKINRCELCDLLIALNVIDDAAREQDPDNHKWSDLHDKLVGILDAFDEAHKSLIGILFSFILPGCVVIGMALRLIINGDD